MFRIGDEIMNRQIGDIIGFVKNVGRPVEIQRPNPAVLAGTSEAAETIDRAVEIMKEKHPS